MNTEVLSSSSQQAIYSTDHIIEKYAVEADQPVAIEPRVNVIETESLYTICIAAPGLQRHHFEIEIEDAQLSVKVEQQMISEGTNTCHEYDYSNWQKTFTLPQNADILFIDALYCEGELTIHIPKNEGENSYKKMYVHVY